MLGLYIKMIKSLEWLNCLLILKYFLLYWLKSERTTKLFMMHTFVSKPSHRSCIHEMKTLFLPRVIQLEFDRLGPTKCNFLLIVSSVVGDTELLRGPVGLLGCCQEGAEPHQEPLWKHYSM